MIMSDHDSTFTSTQFKEILNKYDIIQKLIIATHSCQGMTINEPYTIHDFDRMHKKLKYVALSRATKKRKYKYNINIYYI